MAAHSHLLLDTNYDLCAFSASGGSSASEVGAHPASKSRALWINLNCNGDIVSKSDAKVMAGGCYLNMASDECGKLSFSIQHLVVYSLSLFFPASYPLSSAPPTTRLLYIH